MAKDQQDTTKTPEERVEDSKDISKFLKFKMDVLKDKITKKPDNEQLKENLAKSRQQYLYYGADVIKDLEDKISTNQQNLDNEIKKNQKNLDNEESKENPKSADFTKDLENKIKTNQQNLAKEKLEHIKVKIETLHAKLNTSNASSILAEISGLQQDAQSIATGNPALTAELALITAAAISSSTNSQAAAPLAIVAKDLKDDEKREKKENKLEEPVEPINFTESLYDMNTKDVSHILHTTEALPSRSR
jgi:hypothetical protein